FERQSIASADRRGDGRVGRRPDIMFIVRRMNKFYELMYAECSRINCTKQKEDDDIKLWRECNDGLYWTQKSRRLEKEQFGIIGIQVARYFRSEERTTYHVLFFNLTITYVVINADSPK
ncbi:4078_t:CDS:2, partial [Ambispora leptoticha]